MRYIKLFSAILVSIILAGCGGGSDLPAKPKFTSHVSFGDSLADIGTYKVGFIAAAGGGQFTINIPNTPTNWTEYLDTALGLPAPCPVVTGLDDGTAGLVPANVGVTYVPTTPPNLNCTGYAQGGARVTALNGVHNYLNGTYTTPPTNLGGAELTYPVVKQISNYLNDHTKFSGNELVSVMVGGNDVIFNLTMVGALQMSPASAVQAMGTAAGELVGDVNTLLTNGAKYVVVAGIPDAADIPSTTARGPQTMALVDQMVTTFNSTLQTGLAALPGSANIIYFDAYTSSKDQVANPAKYGFTNTTSQVCAPVSPLTRALLCTPATLITGETAATHYMFADDTHPTPYGNSLTAIGVLGAMTAKGWY